MSQQQQHMIRPNQIDSLPFLEPGLKAQYKNGLTNLWMQYESLPDNTPTKQEVKAKIITASHRIMQTISARQKPGQTAQARPQNNQPGINQQAQPQQGQQQAQQQQSTQGQQGSDQDAAIKARIAAEVNTITVAPPPSVTSQAQFDEYKTNFKTQYGTLRYRAEKAKEANTNLQRHLQQMQAAGQPISEELKNKFTQGRNAMAGFMSTLKTLTDTNEQNLKLAQARKAQSNGQNAQQSQPNNGEQSQQRPPTQQGMHNVQPDQVNAASAQQHTQMGYQGNQPPTQQQPSSQQQPPRPQQMQNATAAPAQTPKPNNQQAPPQQRPPLNPQAAQQYSAQYSNTPNSAMPQSATSGTPQLSQPPRALSQQGAIAKAQEQVLQQQQQNSANAQQLQQPAQPLQQSAGQQQSQVAQQGAGQQSGVPNMSAFNHQPPPQGTPTSGMPGQSQSALNPKFPIPKQLNLGPQSQTPVAGPPSRPTMMGQGGMMNMPGVQKPPQFTLEGEGDHVLSKRKLDELVRQVTGSTDSADGLTPEVEESVLALADDFVDNVITKACQLAKLRPNQTLELRDVQIVLERNYGIRIPGYSLDEVRTVKKFQPAPGWIQKAQAVSASKVMGNNRDL